MLTDDEAVKEFNQSKKTAEEGGKGPKGVSVIKRRGEDYIEQE